MVWKIIQTFEPSGVGGAKLDVIKMLRLARPTRARNRLRSRLLICVGVLLFGGFSTAMASERLALVIGVSAYKNISQLKNTVNDSKLISSSLRELGFDVTELQNPDLSQIRKSIATFAVKSEIADVALVYFAGHGMELGGRNFLLPADIVAKNRREAALESISLDEVLVAVDKARQLRIVVLDSCRNDPFSESETSQIELNTSTGTGLAPASPDRGTLVAYAAKAGSVALDGTDSNSPFATALSKHVSTPNLEIGLMFRRVRDSVLTLTSNKQEPHTYGSLSGKPFFLAGSSQTINKLENRERLQAWARLAVDQEGQLKALASEGDTRALKGLAYMRLSPDSTAFNPKDAVRHLTNAANLGDPEAKFELARLYERGTGTEQDIKRALELYKEAAALNFPDAINDLGFLHFQGGLGIIKNQKRALALFERAADLRHPPAMFNLAALIDDGIVPNKSAKDAASYLYQSLRSGNESVLNQLSTNPNMFKKNTREELQRMLAENSFYTGGIDGQIGPATVRGLKKAYGLND